MSSQASVETIEEAVVLSDPTPEMAARLLAEVDFDQRITGVKMAAMGGANPMPLYSLPAVANFIHVDRSESLMDDRNATVGYVDPAALARWVAGVFGDTELADAITAEAAAGEFYGSVALPIKALLDDRIAQCRAILEPVEASGDSSEADA